MIIRSSILWSLDRKSLSAVNMLRMGKYQNTTGYNVNEKSKSVYVKKRNQKWSKKIKSEIKKKLEGT